MINSEIDQDIQQPDWLDPLTGVANRCKFYEVLKKEWQRLLEQKQTTGHCHPISLLTCDLDYFKIYNDHYGHAMGDECLKQVAMAITQGSQGNFVARSGGEEFAVILPDTDADGALTVARNIMSALESQKIPHAKSHVSDYVTLSIGVGTHIPEPGESPDILLTDADCSLYVARNHGRNRVIKYGV